MKNVLIKFYDPSGELHFGQATITRTTSVNGGLSLTGEVFAGDDVLNGLDYGWWLNFDNEKYVITYKKLSDDTNTIVFDAVQQFFWDFAKVALHSQYTGSHKYTFYLNQLFNGSKYTYQNDATVPAFEKDNWGYKNKLSLFNGIMDQADVEFEVHNERVHIAKQIGSDLTGFVRKGINLSDLTEEMKISDFATYAKGYGAFKDSDDHSKGRLEVEYRSELAKKFGDLEMDPIADERYTVASNLIAALKKQVDATYTVSMNMNIYDLENAGYPNYESPKVGDWILAIDEALNFKRKVRIIKLEEQFDATGKRIGYTATCGDLSVVDQYTNIQNSLDSKVQSIQKSVDNVAISADGKSSNYYGAKEPVSANDGDLWFDQSNSDPDKWSIKQWANGRWEQLTLNPGEVSAKVEVARVEAETATNNANTAVENSNKAISSAGFASDAASTAIQAASSAVVAANEAAGGVTVAKNDAANALTSATTAFNTANGAKDSAGTALDNAKSALDKVNGMQIGGTNLLRDTGFNEDGHPHWQGPASLDVTDTYLGHKAVSFDETGLTGSGFVDFQQVIYSSTTQVVKLGDWYTLSFYAKGSGKFASFVYPLTIDRNAGAYADGQFIRPAPSDGDRFWTLTDDWVRHTYIFKTNSSISTDANAVQRVLWRFYVGAKVSICMPQLEMGNLVSDYSQSPLDVQVQISDINGELSSKVSQDTYNTLAGTVEQVSTLSKQNKSALVAKADSQTVDTLKQRVTTAENTLTQTATKTELQQTETDVDKLNDSVNTNTTDITAQAGKIDGLLSSTTDINGKLTTLQGSFDLSSQQLSTTMSKVDGQTTSINDLKADSSGFKAQFTTVNNTLGKQNTDIGTLQATSKSLSANFDSLSSDNKTNQHDIGQLQASAKGFSSTLETVQTQVDNSAVGTNLLANTADNGVGPVTIQGDTSVPQYSAPMARNSSYIEMTNATGSELYYRFCNTDPAMHNLKPGQTYTIQGEVYVSKGSVRFRSQHQVNGGWTDYTGCISGELATNNTEFVKVSYTFTIPSNSTAAYISWQVYDFDPSTIFRFRRMKLEIGSNATDYSVNPLDNATVTALMQVKQTADGAQALATNNHGDITSLQITAKGLQSTVESKADQSQITQLKDDINLRMKKGDVINQINISPESVLIAGKKVHITGETHIDNAIIKSAMIESLEADKIRTGTLDADKVNVIHLNAGNITAGVINGPNLRIDLDTGEILFQKGAIRSKNGNLNIDIDSGKMAVINSDGNGFRFEDGNLYLTSNTWMNSSQSKPDYGYISYEPSFLSNAKGMKIAGTEGIAVTAGNYDASSFLFQRQPNSGAALALHDNTAFLNAREHVRIEGGSMYSVSVLTDTVRATIIVGGENGGANHNNATDKYGGYNPQEPVDVGQDLFMKGQEITLQGGSGKETYQMADLNLHSDSRAALIQSAAIYNRTYSSGDHVVITNYGTLGRLTSARKYKIADTPALDVISKAKRILDIKPAEWYDKAEMESIADAKTNGTEAPREAKIEKHYGFIADDFDAAGLTEVVLYKDGEVDSLAYDRIPMYHNVILTDHEKRIAKLEAELKQLKGEIQL